MSAEIVNESDENLYWSSEEVCETMVILYSAYEDAATAALSNSDPGHLFTGLIRKATTLGEEGWQEFLIKEIEALLEVVEMEKWESLENKLQDYDNYDIILDETKNFVEKLLGDKEDDEAGPTIEAIEEAASVTTEIEELEEEPRETEIEELEEEPRETEIEEEKEEIVKIEPTVEISEEPEPEQELEEEEEFEEIESYEEDEDEYPKDWPSVGPTLDLVTEFGIALEKQQRAKESFVDWRVMQIVEPTWSSLQQAGPHAIEAISNHCKNVAELLLKIQQTGRLTPQQVLDIMLMSLLPCIDMKDAAVISGVEN
jgi:hypothetical protein